MATLLNERYHFFWHHHLTSFGFNHVFWVYVIVSGFDPFYSERLSFLCSSVFNPIHNRHICLKSEQEKMSDNGSLGKGETVMSLLLLCLVT